MWKYFEQVVRQKIERLKKEKKEKNILHEQVYNVPKFHSYTMYRIQVYYRLFLVVFSHKYCISFGD